MLFSPHHWASTFSPSQKIPVSPVSFSSTSEPATLPSSWVVAQWPSCSGKLGAQFRYLMIKYADRGLVSNGLNLELYNKLFWICSAIFLLLYHAILLAMNLSEDNFIEKTITGSLCCDPSKPLSLSKYFTENSRNIVLRVSFVSFNMGYSLILYVNVTTLRNIL